MNDDMYIKQGHTIMPVSVREVKPPFGLDVRTWFEYKAKLATKKNAILAGVARIPKNGFNKEHSYYFARESDVNDGLRELMRDNKLDFDIELVSVNEYEAKRGAPITEALLSVTWTDCETGFFETRQFMGRGLDYGEKGIYKAYTGGIKYFMLKTFLIATGDDPEDDATPDEQKGQQSGRDNSTGQRQNNGQQGRSGQTRGQSGRNNKQDDKQEPAEKPANEVSTTPITSDQMGKIKTKLLTLAAFSDDKNKKQAETAVIESLRVKIKTKFGMSFGDISDLTAEQAETAIFCLDEWVKLREQKKKDNQKNIDDENKKQDGESE